MSFAIYVYVSVNYEKQSSDRNILRKHRYTVFTRRINSRKWFELNEPVNGKRYKLAFENSFDQDQPVSAQSYSGYILFTIHIQT